MAGSDRLTGRSLVAHCDWGKPPRKRWMAVATRAGDRWAVTPPEPVGSTSDLFARLTARAGKAGVLVGFDFPLGLPEAYASKTGLPDFPAALAAFGLGEWAEWYDVCERAEEISLHRPFYPMRTASGTRHQHLTAGLGLEATDLLRRCERPTTTRRAACSLFWTLGGNQVGKGAIAGWRELIAGSLETARLWPFHGSLAELDATAPLILAETYPAEFYGHLGILKSMMRSKRIQAERKRVARPLLDWLDAHGVPDASLRAGIEEGFGTGANGEDRFDAFVGLLGMIDVLDGRLGREAPSAYAITTWEGWILGQAASLAPEANE